MNELALPLQHVKARKDRLLTPEVLDQKHCARDLWEVIELLDTHEVIFHLLRCHIDQAVYLSDFALNLLENVLEGRWTTLSTLW